MSSPPPLLLLSISVAASWLRC